MITYYPDRCVCHTQRPTSYPDHIPSSHGTGMTARSLAATRVVGVGLVSCVLAASCVKNPASRGRELRVGVVLPLTGDLAAYGSNARDGIELAAEQLNDTPGGGSDSVLRIRLFVEDSKGEPASAVSAFRKLVSLDNVTCVIGDVGSSPTLAMAPIANEAKVVLMSPAASAPAISQAGPFVFRVWPSDVFEAAGVAAYLGRRGYHRIAVVYVNNDYGQAMLGALRLKVQEFGATVIAAEAFDQNSTDMRTQLTKARSSHPDVLVLFSYPKDSAIILRQFGELGLRAPIVATSSFEDPQVISAAPRIAEGVVFTSPMAPSASDSAVSRFRHSYQDKYKRAPGLVADYGYDALRVLAAAAGLSKGMDGEHIRSGLAQIKNFDGASGLINFDANGDVIRQAGLKVVRNGSFVWLTGVESQ